MAGTKVMLSAAVEAYFTNLGRMRDSGGATGERPAYGPLANLLNAVGAALKPKVFCVGDTLVLGVTKAPLRPAIAAIAVPATTAGGHLAGEDFAVTTGWEHHGKGDAVMPGQSRTVERAHTGHERATTGDALPALDDPPFDLYLNGAAFWRNIPAAVWSCRHGDYQVPKKWLSYRKRPILGRPLKLEEVQHFSELERRIHGIILSTAQDSST